MPRWRRAISGYLWIGTVGLHRRRELDALIDVYVAANAELGKVNPLNICAIELVADSGARLYACKATVEMFGLTMEAFVPQVDEIITHLKGKLQGGEVVLIMSNGGFENIHQKLVDALGERG